MNELSKNTETQQSCETSVKCRFFGQYFEQIVAKETKYPNSPTINTTTVLLINELSNYHLELKPTSKITVLERKELNKLTSDKSVVEYLRIKKDFLRSKGYAVPFMEYSVEDLVSFGWVQLV